MEMATQMSIFGIQGIEPERKRMRGEVVEIPTDEAGRFLLPRHYSGRIPSISKAFGWYVDGRLMAVCTFGKPASPSLCDGICGKEYSQNVYELNRLCREDGFDEPLSCFVSACLRRLRTMRWIIVSYSDTGVGHHGYIYQACNFLYTGATKERTDIYTGDGKHSRHYTDEDMSCGYRQVRSAKHRYVYFCTHLKSEKDEWRRALKYPVQPYPKGDNFPPYKLGTIAKPRVVEDEKHIAG